MSQPTAPAYVRPAVTVAVAATTLGLFVTCVFASLGWLGDRTNSLADAISGGVRAWLVSQGSGLTVDGVAINAIPLGATVVLVGLVAWVCAAVVDEPIEDVAGFTAVCAGVAGVAAAVLSVVTSTDDFSTGMVRSTVGVVLVTAAGATLGLARANGGLSGLWFTDVDVRAVVKAAWTGVMALLVAALGLFIIMFALHFDRASDLWAALDPGFLGGLALAAGCILVLPNLVLWTASVLVGPGFVVGPSTSVDLTGAHLGAVPGLPLFAALPDPGQFGSWVFLLGLTPLFAGAVAGWNVRAAAKGLLHHILLGVAAGALAGLACGALIAISGGAIGPGRMSEVGPSHVTPAVVAVGILAVGGAIGASLGHYRGARAHNSPSGRPRVRLWHQSSGTD